MLGGKYRRRAPLKPRYRTVTMESVHAFFRHASLASRGVATLTPRSTALWLLLAALSCSGCTVPPTDGLPI